MLDAIERIDGHESNDVVRALCCLRETDKCKLLVSVTKTHLDYLVGKAVFEETCKRIAVDSVFSACARVEESVSLTVAGTVQTASYQTCADGSGSGINADANPDTNANVSGTEPKSSTDKRPEEEDTDADPMAEHGDSGGGDADASPDSTLTTEVSDCEDEDRGSGDATKEIVEIITNVIPELDSGRMLN